jgi:mannan endo-1,4-beta-mannosidase
MNALLLLAGAQQYVTHGLGPGHDLPKFYTDDLMRSYYKTWIKDLITRTNTVTGQRYIDDPTILAW